MAILSVTYEQATCFEAAAEAAGLGYNNPEILSEYPKSICYQSGSAMTGLAAYAGHCIAALGVVIVRNPHRKLQVLDVGGEIGGHYAIARSAFGETFDAAWTVLETETFVAHGRQWVDNPAISFISHPGEAPAVLDLAYFSGSLQYVADPEAVLRLAADRSAGFIFIARTIFDAEDCAFLQTVTYDTKVIRYPERIISRSRLDDLMAQLGYELIMSLADEHHCLGAVRPAPALLWRRSQVMAS